jgi:hypothetical protein
MSSVNKPCMRMYWKPHSRCATVSCRCQSARKPSFARPAPTQLEHGVERAVGLLQVGGNNPFRQPVGRGAGKGLRGGSQKEAASGELFNEVAHGERTIDHNYLPAMAGRGVVGCDGMVSVTGVRSSARAVSWISPEFFVD